MKIGLKLYSTNSELLSPAEDLYHEGVFQYVELYVVPRSTSRIREWQGRPFPYILHAPHSMSGFNMALPEMEETNRAILRDVECYRSALDPHVVIFHCGVDGTIEETVRQLRLFKDAFPEMFAAAVVENKPRKGLKGEYCLGASPNEIERILLGAGLGFCLDFGHAICYAATMQEDYWAAIDRFLRLKPALYHLSDGYAASETDNHLHFGDGDFPIGKLLAKIPFDSWLSIEAPKDEHLHLEDFLKDARFLTERMADLTKKNGLGLQIRGAQMDDARILYEWVTDPVTNAASFTVSALEYSEHEKWLAAKLADQDVRIMVFSAQGAAVGQVRLERREDALEVDISVAPAERGKGYATAMLKAAREYAPTVWGECSLTAHIKPENTASIKAFLRAGFENRGNVVFKGFQCVLMEARNRGKF